MIEEPAVNPRDKTFLVCDSGLFQHCAEHLATKVKRVIFHNPTWKEAFSSSKRLEICSGIENIEIAENLWEAVKQADIVVFPDIQHGDLQEQLVATGKRVWGSRMGQELEMDRWAFRGLLEDLGMPVAPAERVIGVDELEKVLAKMPEAYIKASATRADWETYHHISEYATRLRLVEFRHQQGPLADDYEFIVEKPIKTDIEMGGDAPFTGAWPQLCEWGYEMKDLGFAGTFSKFDALPEPIRYVYEKFAPVLRELGYAGSFSSEVRVKGKDFFFTDPTARMGSPPSQLFWEMCGNWPERMWFGAEGQVVEPVVLAKYGFMAMAYSSECDTDTQWYGYPDRLAQWYKFSFSCMIDGQRYSLPQRCGMPFQAYICAMDDDPTEAIKKLVDHSRQLKGDGLDIRLECLLHAIKEIHHAAKLGYKFGDGKLPSISEVAGIVTA